MIQRLFKMYRLQLFICVDYTESRAKMQFPAKCLYMLISFDVIGI